MQHYLRAVVGPFAAMLFAMAPFHMAFGQQATNPELDQAGVRPDSPDVASANRAADPSKGGYLASKRQIHERVTGERLDENGRSAEVSMAAQSGEVSAKRVQTRAATSPLTVSNVRMKQRENSKLVDITYDITGGSGNRCRVTIEICDDKTCIVVKTLDFVTPGKNLSYVWNAGTDWPNHFSKNVNAKITAEETNIPLSWADIEVQWGSYGGRDLDICGYWVDRPTVKVGWSWGSGSESAAYRSHWFGDNVESGPERIIVGVNNADIASQVATRKYRIHFNYFGELGHPSNAKVVVSNNGKTLSETQSASKRLGTRANTGDPCITITFDEYGTPIDIKKGY